MPCIAALEVVNLIQAKLRKGLVTHHEAYDVTMHALFMSDISDKNAQNAYHNLKKEECDQTDSIYCLLNIRANTLATYLK